MFRAAGAGSDRRHVPTHRRRATRRRPHRINAWRATASASACRVACCCARTSSARRIRAPKCRRGEGERRRKDRMDLRRRQRLRRCWIDPTSCSDRMRICWLTRCCCGREAVQSSHSRFNIVRQNGVELILNLSDPTFQIAINSLPVECSGAAVANWERGGVHSRHERVRFPPAAPTLHPKINHRFAVW